MSRTVGYRPDRIAALDRATREAIAGLSHLRCDDPAAAGAMRSIVLTRRNLEDHWMPLIMAIRASEAMTTWNTSVAAQIDLLGMRLDQWFSFLDDRIPPAPYAHLSDDELFDQLYAAGHMVLAANAREAGPLVVTDDPFWTSEFPGYAAELAARVATDPDFAARAADSISDVPLIALATAYADFPATFIGAGVGVMLGQTRWWNPAHQAGAEALVGELIEAGPDAALDALLDPDVLRRLLEPHRLPTELTDTVMRTGLYDAVLADSTRLADGAAVLQTITGLVDGPLDSGMDPGAARAIAFSMRGYLPHIAPGVKFEDDESPVRMVDAAGERLIELGTYPEVSNLFGSIMRDHDAQVLIGVALGRYTDEVINGLGGGLVAGTGISAVAHLGDLLRESLANEQAEMVAAAAATAAGGARMGDIIGFGVNVVQTYLGVTAATTSLTRYGIDHLTSRFIDVLPAQMPTTSLRQATYDNITLSVVTMLVTRPSVRNDLGLGSVTDEQWDRIAERLDAVDALEPGADRETAIFDLERTIANVAPDVDAVLGDVRAKEGVGELTEARPVGG